MTLVPLEEGVSDVGAVAFPESLRAFVREDASHCRCDGAALLSARLHHHFNSATSTPIKPNRSIN